MTTQTRTAPFQVLSFVVGNEEYAIEILRVQEIKCFTSITPIPNAAPHIKGVMNLRGAVVPVVDLRVRFGLPAAVCTPLTVIILVVVQDKTVGFIVDAVSDVLQIAPEAVTPPPDIGAVSGHTFVSAIARVDERLVGLIDVEVVGGMDRTGAAA